MASKGSEVGVSDGKIQIFLEDNKKMFNWQIFWTKGLSTASMWPRNYP